MNYPRLHVNCRTKLFAILKSKEFYCLKCNVRITALDENGNHVGPGINPIITEEQIKTIVRNNGTPIQRKVIYKLVARPQLEKKNESS